MLLLATTVVNLLGIWLSVTGTYLNSTSLILDAEEAFYRARNFEESFILSAARGPDHLKEWAAYWNPIFGTYSFSGACIPFRGTFDEFLNRTLLFKSDRVFLLPLEDGPSCLVLSVEYKGFKTRGAIISPLCVNRSSPFSPC